jgi:hypothetical protein
MFVLYKQKIEFNVNADMYNDFTKSQRRCLNQLFVNITTIIELHNCNTEYHISLCYIIKIYSSIKRLLST